MKQLFCDKCGCLVIECAEGSKIRTGIKIKCAKCCKPSSNTPDIPDFLKDALFKNKR